MQDVVLALLFAGADTSPKDARGFDVMIEGARGNREDIIDVLKRSGARTGISIMLQVRVCVMHVCRLKGCMFCGVLERSCACTG